MNLQDSEASTSRRQLLQVASTAAFVSAVKSYSPALAVQGLTAGRIPVKCPCDICIVLSLDWRAFALACKLFSISFLLPLGLSAPDADGYQTYVRPEGKSGGHGVGWSEIPRYSFKVPKGWEETPVSIADLGGTEVCGPPCCCTPTDHDSMGTVWPSSERPLYPYEIV